MRFRHIIRWAGEWLNLRSAQVELWAARTVRRIATLFKMAGIFLGPVFVGALIWAHLAFISGSYTAYVPAAYVYVLSSFTALLLFGFMLQRIAQLLEGGGQLVIGLAAIFREGSRPLPGPALNFDTSKIMERVNTITKMVMAALATIALSVFWAIFDPIYTDLIGAGVALVGIYFLAFAAVSWGPTGWIKIFLQKTSLFVVGACVLLITIWFWLPSSGSAWSHGQFNGLYRDYRITEEIAKLDLAITNGDIDNVLNPSSNNATTLAANKKKKAELEALPLQLHWWNRISSDVQRFGSGLKGTNFSGFSGKFNLLGIAFVVFVLGVICLVVFTIFKRDNPGKFLIFTAAILAALSMMGSCSIELFKSTSSDKQTVQAAQAPASTTKKQKLPAATVNPPLPAGTNVNVPPQAAHVSSTEVVGNSVRFKYSPEDGELNAAPVDRPSTNSALVVVSNGVGLRVTVDGAEYVVNGQTEIPLSSSGGDISITFTGGSSGFEYHGYFKLIAKH